MKEEEVFQLHVISLTYATCPMSLYRARQLTSSTGSSFLKIVKMVTMAAIIDIRTERFWISMSLRCLSSSFGAITVWEEMSFEEFQYGCRGYLLGYRNGKILAILNLHVTPMPPIKFQHRLIVWEEIWFEEFQDGHHPGYWNGRILAILNLQVAPIPPIKFQLKLMNLEISKMWKINDWWRKDGRKITDHGISWPGAKLKVSL